MKPFNSTLQNEPLLEPAHEKLLINDMFDSEFLCQCTTGIQA